MVRSRFVTYFYCFIFVLWLVNMATNKLINYFFGQYILTDSSSNPDKEIHRYGIFSWEEDKPKFPWIVPSPLKVKYPVAPWPNKFKEHLSNFAGDGIVSVDEHLWAFSNTCTILSINENDCCMLLFKNYLQGHVASLFDDLSNEWISNWFELS